MSEKNKIDELKSSKKDKLRHKLKEVLFGGPGSGRRPEGESGNDEESDTKESVSKRINVAKKRLGEIHKQQTKIMEANGLDPIDDPEKLPYHAKEMWKNLQTEKISRGVGLGQDERLLKRFN